MTNPANTILEASENSKQRLRLEVQGIAIISRLGHHGAPDVRCIHLNLSLNLRRYHATKMGLSFWGPSSNAKNNGTVPFTKWWLFWGPCQKKWWPTPITCDGYTIHLISKLTPVHPSSGSPRHSAVTLAGNRCKTSRF